MPFRNSILGGTQGTLLREAMQSEGFQTGIDGWRVTRDGDAEFNDIFVRGSLVTGFDPDPRIEIPNSENRIDWYSGSSNETGPAQIINDADGASELNDFTIRSSTSTDTQGSPDRASIVLSPNNGIDLPTGLELGSRIDYSARQHIFTGEMLIDANNMAFASAVDNNNDASAQTNSTAFVALVGSTGPQTNPFGTVRASASGRYKIHISCDMSPSNIGGITLTSFQLRDFDSTGTLLLAVGDAQAILLQASVANDRANFGRTFLVDLGAGVTSGLLFFQMLHRVVNVATLGTFRRRYIFVEPSM